MEQEGINHTFKQKNKKMHIVKILLLFSIAIIMLPGCRDNRGDIKPKYILVDTLLMELGPGQGTEKHNFREVWAYSDFNFVGAFPLPAEIPVLSGETTQLSFFPGYRLYGQVNFPDNYPFAIRYDTTITVPDETEFIPINPSVRINPLTNFNFVETFEAGSSFTFRFAQENSVNLEIYDGDAYDGTKCGRAVLTEENFLLQQGNSIQLGNIPFNGTPVMLELSYKSEVQLGIGFYAYTALGESVRFVKVVMFPNENWNRVYVPIEDELNVFGQQGITSIRILVEAVYNPNLDKEQQEVLIDEIKLLHF